MKIKILLFLILLSVLTVPSVVNAQEYEQVRINPDTYFSIGTNNEPAKQEPLNVSFSEGESKLERVYIKIPLDEVPQNVIVTEAKLNLQISNCSGVTANINIARVTSDWSGENLKWENKPGFSTPVITSELDCINQLASWDITELIKGWRGNVPNFGVVIYGPDEAGTPPYSRVFDPQSENSFVTVDYEIVSNTPEPTNDSNSNRNLLIIVLISIIIILPILAGAVFLFMKKRKKPSETKVEEKENTNEIKIEEEENMETQTQEVEEDNKDEEISKPEETDETQAINENDIIKEEDKPPIQRLTQQRKNEEPTS